MVEDGGHVEGKGFGEFDIIARYFAPLATDASALSLRDDAAVLRPPEGLEIVLSCDTVIEGVHFLSDDPPDSIGHKALAVNLSDLAAKGARPYVYLLALSLPATRVTPDWLEAFASGLGDLQRHCGISLAGGDTTKTPGPLCITITALGLVPHGHAALRHGGKRGDLLYVTGTIGDAYLGLRLLKEPALAARLGLSEDDVSFPCRPLSRATAAQRHRDTLAELRLCGDRCVGRPRGRRRQARRCLSCRRRDRGSPRAALASLA